MAEIIDSITVYFEDIGRYPLLSSEDEKTLAQKMSEGDICAQKKLVECNLRLVANIAARYLKAYDVKCLDYLDMIQEGNIGLLHAVEKFDYTKDYKFSTFASYWIKCYIRKAIIQKEENIRLPDDRYVLYKKYKKTISGLYNILGREPKIEEIAEEMQINLKKARELQLTYLKTRSLQEFIEDAGTELGEILFSNEPTPEDIYLMKERDILIQKMLNECLTDREIKIVLLRLGFITGKPLTLEKIGAYMKISYQRVSAIYKAAIEKIKSRKDIQVYQLKRNK